MAAHHRRQDESRSDEQLRPAPVGGSRADPAPTRRTQILALQRVIGNRNVGRLLSKGAAQTVQRNGAYGVQVGETDDVSLIHKVEPAEGNEGGTVRCYLTIFARAEKGQTFKDIHGASEKIVFINKTADTMLNMGDPRRAFHYIRTYTNQKSPAQIPIIRSFDIPRQLYDEVTEASISESQRGKLGKDKPYNVDKERGQNQFGLPAWARDKIESQGKNLISYVEQLHVTSLQADSSNGDVRDIDELLSGQLGMPDAKHRKFLVPMHDAHVPSPQQEANHGANLTKFYDDLDDLVDAMEAKRGNPLHVYAFQIEPNCHKVSSGYYGDVVAPLVMAEGYLPGRSLEEVKKLRDEVGRAATFSVIPQMVTEEYLQANARLHGQARDKNQDELSPWAQAQNYDVRAKPLVAKQKAKPKLSQADIEKRRQEAAERAKQKKQVEAGMPSKKSEGSVGTSDADPTLQSEGGDNEEI